MSERVLVTGGAGFIGGHVIEALERAGHHATILDAYLLQNESPLRDGVMNAKRVIEAASGCTCVIHLAAFANARLCEKMPRDACKMNIGGCRNLAYSLMHTSVNRIIYANSCAAADPISVYGFTKRAGLLELRDGAAEYDAEVISLRLANVYGPGDGDASRAVPNLIHLARNGGEYDPATLSFGGRLARDFVHVTDVAKAFVQAVELPRGHAPQDIEIGIGTGRRTSLRDLHDMIGRMFGRELPAFIPGPSNKFEPLSAGEDPNLASALLNWRPTITLEEGLRDLCANRA